MSPTSYRAAPPRGFSLSIARLAVKFPETNACEPAFAACLPDPVHCWGPMALPDAWRSNRRFGPLPAAPAATIDPDKL